MNNGNMNQQQQQHHQKQLVQQQNVQSTNGMKLYTSRYTPPCRAVAMLAAHLNIQMEEIHTRTFIDTRTEKFKKLNPCHNVPVLDDNGFILWESRVIMQYLCNKFAPNSDIYPADPKKRAVVDRLLYFDLKTLSNAVFEVHYNFTFPNEYSASRANNLMAVTQALTLLEIFLINKNYMACDHLTIADLSILASITLLEVAAEYDFTSYPNIWNWYNRLRTELPYYDRQTEIVHGELKEIIRSIRDKHEDWSTPLHRCAFVPGDGSDKCKEEREQYKRLFLNKNEQDDAKKILAAVRPSVFRKPFHNSETCRNLNCSPVPGFHSENSNADSLDLHSESSDSGSQISRKKSVGRMSSCSQDSRDSCDVQTKRSMAMKRIRLTIESSTTEILPLGLESPQIINNEPKWMPAGHEQAFPSPEMNHSMGFQEQGTLPLVNYIQQQRQQQPSPQMQQHQQHQQVLHQQQQQQQQQHIQQNQYFNQQMTQVQYQDYNPMWETDTFVDPYANMPETVVNTPNEWTGQTFCENYNRCNQTFCNQC